MEAIARRRKDVLARVLLHVIEAAGPVHAPADARPFDDRSGDDVANRPVLKVDDIGHVTVAKRTGVVRLTAGRRIERRAVESHDGAAVHG